MASKKRLPLTPEGIAKRVKKQRDEGDSIYTLAINEHYDDPQAIDELRGVKLGASEVSLGERGMALRVTSDTLPPNLADWVRAQTRKMGGTRRLAEELVAQEHDEGRAETETRNMIRKLEEWTQTSHRMKNKAGEWEVRPGPKYKTASGRNARRVSKLILRGERVQVGVTGWWKISEDVRFRRIDTDPYDEDDSAAVRDALFEGGDGLVNLVIESVNDAITGTQTMQLLSVHGLHVEASE